MALSVLGAVPAQAAPPTLAVTAPAPAHISPMPAAPKRADGPGGTGVPEFSCEDFVNPLNVLIALVSKMPVPGLADQMKNLPFPNVPEEFAGPIRAVCGLFMGGGVPNPIPQ